MLAAQWSVLEVVLAAFGGGILFIFGMAAAILVVASILAEAVHRDLSGPAKEPVLREAGIRRAARATVLSLVIFLCSGAGAFFLLEYFSTADAVCVGCP